jgi:diguanylate cyclase (GGDEF)-like protein/putative nucleotidyltransferase with HDIG domain
MSDEARQLGRDSATAEIAVAEADPRQAKHAAEGAPTQRVERRSTRPTHTPSPIPLLKISRGFAAAIALVTVGAFVASFLSPVPTSALKVLVICAAGLLAGLAALQYRMHQETMALNDEFRRAQQLARLNSSVIASFAMAIDAKDQHTHGHTERVRRLARMIGEEMGLSDDELQALETAAMLHDIGKLAVPDYILSKPGVLSQEEMKKVETHTLVGAAILEPVQFPWPVIPSIRSHHEWYDGSGYPDRLVGDQIPLGARILAVADVYDALLSHRPFRPAKTVQDAVQLMRDRSGTQFDPDILSTCFRVLAAQQATGRFDFIFDANSNQAPQDTAGSRAIFQDIKHAHQELLALYEIVQTMGQSLDVQETLDLIMNKTKRIIDFATCVIFLREGESSDLKAMSAAGPFADIIQNRRLPAGSGCSGWAAQNCTTSGLGRSAGDDLMLLLGPSARNCALTEVLAAPLGTETESIGALTLYRASDRPFTEDDARLLTAVARQATVAISNARRYEQTRQSAMTDQLTGLANARFFLLHLDQELSRARRDQNPVSLVAIDLNNLKQINDNFGHQQGDRALRMMAEVFRRHVRDYDTVVRYAGDEFFIILPDTPNQRAVETSNRIKRAVRETVLDVGAGKLVNLGASFGVATFPGDAKEIDALIAAADSAMYKDKNLNRQAAMLTQARQSADETRPPGGVAPAGTGAPNTAAVAAIEEQNPPGPR